MITPLTEHQRQIIEENHNLIWDFLINHRLNADEWYDILALACCKGVAVFDFKSNTAISTYLYKCMKNAYLNELRYLHSSKRFELLSTVSLDSPVTSDDIEHCTYADIIPTSEDIITFKLEAMNDLKFLHTLKLKLTDQEYLVLQYLISGYRQCEICKLLKLSRSRTSQIVHQIRKKTNSIRNLFSI